MYPLTATPGGAMSARCVEGAVTAPRAVAFAGQDRWLAGHIPGARLGELRARTTCGWLPEPSRFADRANSGPVSKDDRGVAAQPGAIARGWARAGAAIYDPFLALGERRGMRDRRAALLAGARGRVLALGAGTGP